MSRKNKIIVSVVGIFIVLLALIGITYGYFLTRIVGNTNSNSISITTANLRLVYWDGTTQILTRENIIPGTIVSTKDFTVTNEGNSDISEYQVYLENVYNDFSVEGQDDVKLTITCTSELEDGTTGTCNGYDSTYPTVNTKLISNSIKVGEVHTYNLKVEYIETHTDQSEDMGKTLQGKVQIYDPKDVVSISGTVTNHDSSYYIELLKLDNDGNTTDTKTSQINSNTYIIPGITPGTYTLNVKYVEDGETKTKGTKTITISKGTEDSVSSDGATIVITDTTASITTNINVNDLSILDSELVDPYAEGTLAYEIINNAKNASSGTNSTVYSLNPVSNVAEVISGASERTLSEEEDDYTATTGNNSYYFRGNVKDNYVDFAGMCWRVVRIEGDGSVKLILEDQDSTCSTSNGNFDIGSGYFGYTYYEAGELSNSTSTEINMYELYVMDYLNGETDTSSSMATAFKNYQTTLNTKIGETYTGETIDTMLKSGNWCLDDRGYSISGEEGSYTFTELTNNQMLDYKVSGTTFYYGAYTRLGNGNANGYNPTLKCNVDTMSTFADSTLMYVGTLTADEIAYAGASWNGGNYNFYLMNEYSTYTYDEETGNENEGVWWWAFSPGVFNSSGDHAFGLVYIGYLFSDHVISNLSFRPAVSLKSGAEIISGGDGTKTNAYVISVS